ncbi:hypothetical protein [uncultured Trichococcus sp.]|uniref:hypothetical protein n=1 Tax=uncultured Trichococcus sp. TaxID=189665 RepID=UPI002A18C4A7|nr:hypothetical protein [uncultured Trichococcus sp.]
MDQGMMDKLEEFIIFRLDGPYLINTFDEFIILRSDSSKLMDNSEESIIRIPACITPIT